MRLPDVSQLPDLPVRAVLGAVTGALAAHGTAVLVAPPGTGKTTLVPLALAAADPDEGRVLPRVAGRPGAQTWLTVVLPASCSRPDDLGHLVGQAGALLLPVC